MNRYQGDVLRIEKYDPDKTFTVLYWDPESKSHYVKRFSFPVSDNSPQCFIAQASKTYLLGLSDDLHPQYEISWKIEDKTPERVDAEEWIAKKGIGAKGKKCSSKPDVASVRFVEPLVKEEDFRLEEKEVRMDEEDETPLPQIDIADSDELEFEEPTLF